MATNNSNSTRLPHADAVTVRLNKEADQHCFCNTTRLGPEKSRGIYLFNFEGVTLRSDTPYSTRNSSKEITVAFPTLSAASVSYVTG